MTIWIHKAEYPTGHYGRCECGRHYRSPLGVDLQRCSRCRSWHRFWATRQKREARQRRRRLVPA